MLIHPHQSLVVKQSRKEIFGMIRFEVCVGNEFVPSDSFDFSTLLSVDSHGDGFPYEISQISIVGLWNPSLKNIARYCDYGKVPFNLEEIILWDLQNHLTADVCLLGSRLEGIKNVIPTFGKKYPGSKQLILYFLHANNVRRSHHFATYQQLRMT